MKLPAKRITLIAVVVLASSTLTTVAYTRETSHTVAFQCPDGEQFSADFTAERARLHVGAGVFVLNRQPSASGARYANDDMSLWTKGDEALLERSGMRAQHGCHSVASQHQL